MAITVTTYIRYLHQLKNDDTGQLLCDENTVQLVGENSEELIS